MREFLVLTWLFKVMATIIGPGQRLAKIGIPRISAYISLAEGFLTLHDGTILERSTSLFLQWFTLFLTSAIKTHWFVLSDPTDQTNKNNLLDTPFNIPSVPPEVDCTLVDIILYKGQTPEKCSKASFPGAILA